MVTETVDRPIYCKDCNGRETFERDPERDVTNADTGEVLWAGWRCRICGATTLISVGLDK